MKESDKASPAILILMAAGIAVCVMFIIHGLSANTSPSAAAPLTNMLPSQTSSASTAAKPVTSPGAAPAATGPVFTAPQDGATASEAELAPNADPFTPFGGWKVTTTTGAPPPATPGPSIPVSPPPGPPKSQPTTPGSLAGFSVQEPELVGTMLGDKPSAVFRVDQRIVLIAQGAQIIGWKVVSIQQGTAVLKGMGRTLRLTTVKPGIAAKFGMLPSTLNIGSKSQSEDVATSPPASRSDPEAGGVGNITVTTVEVSAAQADQSSLPQRSDTGTDNNRVTSDGTGDSNSVAVSGPFVHPVPQLLGAINSAAEPWRNSRGSDGSVPVPSGEADPEPMPAPVEYRASITGSQNASDATPNQIVAQGPRPRHHRRRMRHHRLGHHGAIHHRARTRNHHTFHKAMRTHPWRSLQ